MLKLVSDLSNQTHREEQQEHLGLLRKEKRHRCVPSLSQERRGPCDCCIVPLGLHIVTVHGDEAAASG